MRDFRKQYYQIKDLRELLNMYIKQNNLDARKGLIKLDPILAQIIPQTLINKENEVAKDQIFKQ